MNLFKRIKLRLFDDKPEEKELITFPGDIDLISMANEILLNRYANVSNGGGGYDLVKLVKCTGITISPNYGYREVRYDTDDSWITGVYYAEEHIQRMYKEYKETNKFPNL